MSCITTGVPLEDMPEEEEQEEVEEDADIGDEDEMADFIVDEDDEDGTLVRYGFHYPCNSCGLCYLISVLIILLIM
jgi:hypothetical protein